MGRQRGGYRVLGPYRDRNGFAMIRVLEDGRRERRRVHTREEGEAVRKEWILPPPPPVPKSWVYFIEGEGTGMIKIGVAENPYRRLAYLQIGSPVILRMLATVRGDASIEAELHDRFGESRAHGEWFRSTPALQEYIARVSPR